MTHGNPPELKITGKITDFGLSSILGSKFLIESSQQTSAIRWQAPELAHVAEDVIEGRKMLLQKADVWSFAMTALEVSIQFRSESPVGLTSRNPR